MDELCTACLCMGRTLYFIGETGSYHLYSQILNEIPVYDFSAVCVRVCWECRALLRRFGEFKALVKRSYTELLQQVHQNIPPCRRELARPPRLSATAVDAFGWPERVKEEVDEELLLEVKCCYSQQKEDIPYLKKEEFEVERHSEPETFTDEVEVARKSRKKKSTKKQKEDIPYLKKEDFEVEHHSEPETFTDEVEVERKGRKRKSTKKTAKEEKKKKVKTKKLEEKERAEEKENSSVSGNASPVVGDDFSDVDSDENQIQTKRLKKQKEVKVKVKRKNATRSKEDKLPASDEAIEETHENTEEKTAKRNGASSPEVPGQKPKCAECGKVFSSKKTYRYHLNVLHKGQNRYPCPRCGKVYQWKSNLGRHMRTHKALDSGELYCAACDKHFASVATYRQHLRVSRRHVTESEFSFICNECGKKFVNKTRLQDHVDWEHLNRIKFRCQLCHKPFKCHTSLYVHMQNVHKNKQKENLCHICGKSYRNAAKLKYHIVAMHTSETPYRCSQCAAAFGWYSSLYRHVREVHYKMKLQPKKMRKHKRLSPPPPPPPHFAHA